MKKKYVIGIIGVLMFGYVIVGIIYTAPIRKSGISYIHAVVYTHPKLINKFGSIIPMKAIKWDLERIGKEYRLTYYEDVNINNRNCIIITGIYGEDLEWKLSSVIVEQNGKSEQLADYGQWK